jgi:NADPH:quinone reductase-like Zn-dependent oxidoreductase
MKSFLIDRYVKGGALRFTERPQPELRENDVMVEIHAASVNLLDCQDQGRGVQAHPALSSSA